MTTNTLPQNTPTAPPTSPQASVTSDTTQTQPSPNVPQGLDPTAYVLTKAIAYQENGGQNPNYNAQGKSGEWGAYQWIKPTWDNMAQQAGVNAPWGQATPDQQNQVAYTWVSNKLKQGYSPAQVASMWNAGEGAPNAFLGNAGTNKYGVQYNTKQYVQNVQKYAEQLWNGQDPTQVNTPELYSVGGFAGNVVKSGANFLGNMLNAVVHPISTIENLGNTAVGGLQELGGQQNQDTQLFDSLKSYFSNRYGSFQNLGNTLYNDPVGFLADLSTVLGTGAGVAGLAAKGADLANLGDLAQVGKEVATPAEEIGGSATLTAPPTEGSGLAGALQKTSSALGSGAMYSNPLSPVIAGIGKLAQIGTPVAKEALGQTLGMNQGTLDTVLEHPEAFTPQNAAEYTRATLAKEIESSLQSKIDALDETGGGYSAIRADETPIDVPPNWLETQLRKVAGVKITDGQISATGDSLVRNPADIRQLQTLFNIWKPEFQQGTITANKLLNLRQDLANVAKFGREFTASKPVESIAANMRSNLNKDFRSKVPNLAETDSKFASQIGELNDLKKGLLDKNGNLLDSAVNKIANATGKGKDSFLARLEQISPNIGQRIKIMRAIEDISNSGVKVGAYTRSMAQAARIGGILYGATTGNIKFLAGALAMDFVSNPQTAVPILQALAKFHPELIAPVVVKMAQMATTGTVANESTGGESNATPTAQADTLPPQSTDQTQQQVLSPTPTQQQSSGTSIPQVQPVNGTEMSIPQTTYESNPSKTIENYLAQHANLLQNPQNHLDLSINNGKVILSIVQSS